jgi:endonuclease/exonuclease/phosphatase (EEP) superfamily protein YafD
VKHPQAQSRLKFVSANVYGSRNYRFDTFVQYIHQVRPDVFVLLEDNPQWMAALRQRLPEYQYSFDEGITTGAAIFSKLPISQIEPPEGRSKRYGVRGELDLNGRKILLVSAHPPAPYNTAKWEKRNHEFSLLLHDVQSSHEPTIIAGDLNCTPWSWYFQQLVKGAALLDSEYGNGIQPSWSTYLLAPLVPIDHCLYTRECFAISRSVGPNIGSDHLPLSVELAVN